MKKFKVFNKTKGTIILNNCYVADSFFKRIKGLMFKKCIPEDEGMLFYYTDSIHTFFMYFPIDVIFLDKNMRVKKMYLGLKPARVAFCWNSYITIEMSAGKITESLTDLCDIIELIPSDG